MNGYETTLLLKTVAFIVVLYILRLDRFKRSDWQSIGVDVAFSLLVFWGYIEVIEAATGIGFSHSPLHSATLEAAGALKIREVIAKHEGLTNLAYIVWTSYFSYWTHRLSHRIGPLWELHKVHHSATRMTGLSQFRAHPGDALLTAWVAPVLITLILPETGPRFALYYGTFVMVHTTIIHSEWKATWGRWSWLFISPLAHQIHHSTNPRHFDSNFGAPFSVWDRLHGTYVDPITTEAPKNYGVDGIEPNNLKMLIVDPVVRFSLSLVAGLYSWSRTTRGYKSS